MFPYSMSVLDSSDLRTLTSLGEKKEVGRESVQDDQCLHSLHLMSLVLNSPFPVFHVK